MSNKNNLVFAYSSNGTNPQIRQVPTLDHNGNMTLDGNATFNSNVNINGTLVLNGQNSQFGITGPTGPIGIIGPTGPSGGGTGTLNSNSDVIINTLTVGLGGTAGNNGLQDPYSIALGYKSLYGGVTGGLNYLGSTGLQNIGIGYQALYCCTTGQYNVAVGNNCLINNTTGSDNYAFGNNCLTNNTTGNINYAFGNNCLTNNRTGSSNFAFGRYCLTNNTTGTYNIAFGRNSLADNITGNNNVTIGFNNFVNAFNPSGNVAIGNRSLSTYSIPVIGITGSISNNSAVGNGSLERLGSVNPTSVSNNSAIGYNAGSNILAGNNNTFLGSNTVGLAGLTGSNNSTALGADASITQSNQIVLGNASISSLNCQVTTITGLSDSRDKKNIKDIPIGLNFVNQLHPVQFEWNIRPDIRTDENGNVIEVHSERNGDIEAGFIAQELDELQISTSNEWLGLVNKDNLDKINATPGKLLPVLVKAIQELSAEIDILKNRVPYVQL